MSARGRLVLLCLAFAALAPGVWHVAAALPAFGYPTSAYGQAVNALVPHARGVANMVAAVNFDVRGIDTLGEEAMLLCAVTGAVVLLRGARGEDRAERAGRVPGRTPADRADATALVARIAAAIMLVFGAYVALHGTVTPGGGFQAGVICASALLLVYLGEGYAAWRGVVHAPVLAAMEGGGALAFAAAAALPLLWGHAALTNTLSPGAWKDLYSGGLMVIVNGAVTVAVAGSFGLLLLEFMEETRAPADDDLPDEEDA